MCQAWRPALFFLASIAHSLCKAAEDMGRGVRRQVGKTWGPRGRKKDRQEFRKMHKLQCQPQKHERSWDGDGSSVSPVYRSKLWASQVRRRKSWCQGLCNLSTIKIGICSQFWGHDKKFSCQEEDWCSQHAWRNEAPGILQKGWGEAVEVFETSFEAALEQAENGGDALNTFDRCQHGPDPSSQALCSKPSPAVWWQVQMLSHCTLPANKLLN